MTNVMIQSESNTTLDLKGNRDVRQSHEQAERREHPGSRDPGSHPEERPERRGGQDRPGTDDRSDRTGMSRARATDGLDETRTAGRSKRRPVLFSTITITTAAFSDVPSIRPCRADRSYRILGRRNQPP